MRGAARGVLRGDAFFAAIEPYRAIFAVALPPDFAGAARATPPGTARDETTTTTTRDDAACAKCWGVSASNAYLNLASARGVVMIRGDSRASPPPTALARALLGGRGDAGTIPGGVLLTPTVHEDARKVSVEDAEFIAQALRAHDARLRDVPFGWWDGPLAESWRAPPEDDDETERAKPAAAKVARARLASFLEQTQGALNTFG